MHSQVVVFVCLRYLFVPKNGKCPYQSKYEVFWKLNPFVYEMLRYFKCCYYTILTK